MLQQSLDTFESTGFVYMVSLVFTGITSASTGINTIRIWSLLFKLAMSYLFSGGIYAIIYHALAEKPGGNVALSRWPPCTDKKKIHGNFTQPLRHKERISNKEANLINTERRETLSLFQSCWETCLCLGRGGIDGLLQFLLFDTAHVSEKHDKHEFHSASS